jgi:hypothetical protein
MLNVIYPECHYAECQYTECRGAIIWTLGDEELFLTSISAPRQLFQLQQGRRHLQREPDHRLAQHDGHAHVAVAEHDAASKPGPEAASRNSRICQTAKEGSILVSVLSNWLFLCH